MAALLAYQQQEQEQAASSSSEEKGKGKGSRKVVVFDLGHAHLDVAVVEEDEKVRKARMAWSISI